MGYDKRIGFEFLRPGPGWGGSCFPKDTRALVRIAQDAGYDFGLLEGIHVGRDPYAVCEGADVLVVLTEWDDFRWLDFAKVAGLMKSARIVDTRNLLEPAAVRRRGFVYDGLGRA